MGTLKTILTPVFSSSEDDAEDVKGGTALKIFMLERPDYYPDYTAFHCSSIPLVQQLPNM